MNTLKIDSIKGIIFVIIVGIISHYVYDWSGQNIFLGLFFPINESTWEHMKLFYFPMLFFSIYLNHKRKKESPCITTALLCGILAGTVLIPILFYTYTGIIGNNFIIADILVFFISTILAWIAVFRLNLSCRFSSHEYLLKLLVIIFGICFILFTYQPPDINLFANP